MTRHEKTPLYRDDDHEFLGFIVYDVGGWQAQTIFGYVIDRTTSRDEVVETLQEKGLAYLGGVWQYYDKDDQDWFPCVIKNAGEHRVTVERTNFMGYSTPDDYKMVTLKDPTEKDLIKSS